MSFNVTPGSFPFGTYGIPPVRSKESESTFDASGSGGMLKVLFEPSPCSAKLTVSVASASAPGAVGRSSTVERRSSAVSLRQAVRCSASLIFRYRASARVVGRLGNSPCSLPESRLAPCLATRHYSGRDPRHLLFRLPGSPRFRWRSQVGEGAPLSLVVARLLRQPS